MVLFSSDGTFTLCELMLRPVEVLLLISRQSDMRFSLVNHIFFPPLLYKAQVRTDPSGGRF